MKIAVAAFGITRLSVCALALCSSPASADPVQITGGSMIATVEGVARTTLEGPEGFSLIGAGTFSGGRFGPFEQCGFAPYCAPGSAIDLLASWSGSDFDGLVTIDGVTHRVGMSSAEQYSASIEFTGAVAAPAFDGALSREVSAPFSFGGILTPPATPDQGPALRLAGHGTATLRLTWTAIDAIEGWQFERAIYTFAAPTPVPEPGSLALLGFGLTSLLAGKLRRRSRHAPSPRVT